MKMSLKITTFFLSVLVSVSLSSCYYDTEEELYPDSGSTICDTISVSYANDIVPIVSAKCSTPGCHAGVNAAAGIALETYVGVQSYLDADKARFISSIIWDGNASNMPKGASTKMSDCNINTIRAWINAGYLNN
jgi:uncharacterized membrane protein